MKKLSLKKSSTTLEFLFMISGNLSRRCGVIQTFVCLVSSPNIMSKASWLFWSRATCNGVVLLPFSVRLGSLCKNCNASKAYVLLPYCIFCRMKFSTDLSTFRLVAYMWNTEIPVGNRAIGDILEIRPLVISWSSCWFWKRDQYSKSENETKCCILPGNANSIIFERSS